MYQPLSVLRAYPPFPTPFSPSAPPSSQSPPSSLHENDPAKIIITTMVSTRDTPGMATRVTCISGIGRLVTLHESINQSCEKGRYRNYPRVCECGFSAVCTHTHIYKPAGTHTYIYTSRYTHTHKHSYKPAGTHTLTHTNIHSHTWSSVVNALSRQLVTLIITYRKQ